MCAKNSTQNYMPKLSLFREKKQNKGAQCDSSFKKPCLSTCLAADGVDWGTPEPFNDERVQFNVPLHV